MPIPITKPNQSPTPRLFVSDVRSAKRPYSGALKAKKIDRGMVNRRYETILIYRAFF